METDLTSEGRSEAVGEPYEDRSDSASGAPSSASLCGEREALSPDHGVQCTIDVFTSDNHVRPLAEIEAEVIRLAIGHYRGQMSEAARRLGIGRSTLYRKLSELEIDPPA